MVDKQHNTYVAAKELPGAGEIEPLGQLAIKAASVLVDVLELSGELLVSLHKNPFIPERVENLQLHISGLCISGSSARHKSAVPARLTASRAQARSSCNSPRGAVFSAGWLDASVTGKFSKDGWDPDGGHVDI